MIILTRHIRRDLNSLDKKNKWNYKFKITKKSINSTFSEFCTFPFPPHPFIFSNWFCLLLFINSTVIEQWSFRNRSLPHTLRKLNLTPLSTGPTAFILNTFLVRSLLHFAELFISRKSLDLHQQLLQQFSKKIAYKYHSGAMLCPFSPWSIHTCISFHLTFSICQWWTQSRRTTFISPFGRTTLWMKTISYRTLYTSSLRFLQGSHTMNYWPPFDSWAFSSEVD